MINKIKFDPELDARSRIVVFFDPIL